MISIFRPELTDDDDEEFRPSSFFNFAKRMKAREDSKKEPVASTSAGVFPNPWRRDEMKVHLQQATSVSFFRIVLESVCCEFCNIFMYYCILGG